MKPSRETSTSIVSSLILPLAGLGLALLIAACEKKTKEEKAKEELGEAIEAVGEAIEEAADR